jgi:hypothetical protein
MFFFGLLVLLLLVVLDDHSLDYSTLFILRSTETKKLYSHHVRYSLFLWVFLELLVERLWARQYTLFLSSSVVVVQSTSGRRFDRERAREREIAREE